MIHNHLLTKPRQSLCPLLKKNVTGGLAMAEKYQHRLQTLILIMFMWFPHPRAVMCAQCETQRVIFIPDFPWRKITLHVSLTQHGSTNPFPRSYTNNPALFFSAINNMHFDYLGLYPSPHCPLQTSLVPNTLARKPSNTQKKIFFCTLNEYLESGNPTRSYLNIIKIKQH